MGAQELFTTEFPAKQGMGIMAPEKLFTAEFSAKRGDEINGGNGLLNVMLGSDFQIYVTIFRGPQNCTILTFCSRNHFDHYQFSGECFSVTSF